MADEESLFTHLISLAPSVVLSAPLALVYFLFHTHFSAGTVGLIGVYLVFIMGLIDWLLPAVNDIEESILVVGLPIVCLIQLTGAIEIHPLLGGSILLAAGNFSWSANFEDHKNIAQQHWPLSISLAPIGLAGITALSPLLTVIPLAKAISWIRGAGESDGQPGTDSEKEDPSTSTQPARNQALETVQQSEQTAHDINARRPDKDDS
jgi:hypothetical protein